MQMVEWVDVCGSACRMDADRRSKMWIRFGSEGSNGAAVHHELPGCVRHSPKEGLIKSRVP